MSRPVSRQLIMRARPKLFYHQPDRLNKAWARPPTTTRYKPDSPTHPNPNPDLRVVGVNVEPSQASSTR